MQFQALHSPCRTRKMKNINRRESQRIDIRLRCHVTSPATWLRDTTYTENISRNGLLISWADNDGRAAGPRIGQIITVEVELPAHHGFGRKCMHLQGTVVRVGNLESGSRRVALSVNYMDFRSFTEVFSSARAFEPALRGWMA